MTRPFVVRAIAVAAAGLLTAALVAVASAPTGAATATATVPEGARLVARVPVESVHVLLISKGGSLSTLVAYRGPKGWRAAPLPPAGGDGDPIAVWAATDGGHGLPALAVVYGRAPSTRAGSVVVRWDDGRRSAVLAASDGAYLAVRSGRVGARWVRAEGTDGRPVLVGP